MSINILGGVAKGFSLATPHDSITRPTSVLLKRRLFDFFQTLHGFEFIDLCAGSGSMGLEAVSRGAENLVLVESNTKAFQILKLNVKAIEDKFKFQNIKLVKSSFHKWLNSFFEDYQLRSLEQRRETIIFFDPPYEQVIFYQEFFHMIKTNFFKGIVIVEACRQKTMEEKVFLQEFGQPDRYYRQGTSFLYLYDYNKD